MPNKAKRVCRRCKKTCDIFGPYCSTCLEKRNSQSKKREKKYQSERSSPTERGYDSSWSKISKRYRKKHILCECNVLSGENLLCGKYTQLVHHIDGNPFNNPPDGSNWLAMAKTCHSSYHAKSDRWQKKGIKNAKSHKSRPREIGRFL